jgi:hypothetical protein
MPSSQNVILEKGKYGLKTPVVLRAKLLTTTGENDSGNEISSPKYNELKPLRCSPEILGAY